PRAIPSRESQASRARERRSLARADLVRAERCRARLRGGAGDAPRGARRRSGDAESAPVLPAALHGGRCQPRVESSALAAGHSAAGRHEAARGIRVRGAARAHAKRHVASFAWTLHAASRRVRVEDGRRSACQASPRAGIRRARRGRHEALPRSNRTLHHARRGRGGAGAAQGEENLGLRRRSRVGRSVTTTSETPLMEQYRQIKGRHQNAILFFRMGEFYEMFYDDAETASRVLGLTLTARNNGGASEVPLAGVPVKAAGDYVRRLVQQGYRVAICEQTEDPKLARGVVRREVIETVTPGAVFADDLLDGTRNNFIVALCPQVEARSIDQRGAAIGVAAADVSTGEVRLIATTAGELDPLMARLAPREILLPVGSRLPLPPSRNDALVTERELWEFDPPLARDDLARQYGVLSLEGFGIESTDVTLIGAAGALLRYLRELQPAGLPQLARPIVERAGGTM